MKIKRYVANDYRTALSQAKNELGQDAIILHSRQIKRNGILGWFTSPQIEITVAMDDTIQVHTDRMRKNESVPWPAVPQTSRQLPSMVNSGREVDLIEEIKHMNQLMEEMKHKILEVENVKGLSKTVQGFYQALTQNRVKPEIAMHIASSIQNRLPQDYGVDMQWANEVCLHTVREYVKDIRPIYLNPSPRARLVFMIGPTGVGKTTTIAKLAANMTFLDSKKVALITIDTYRVAAADQLRTFADIMDIPLSVVFSDAEMKEAIDKYREFDIIFVDTAGCSPFNQEQLVDLERFVKAAQPDDTILVLSVTTDSDELLNICHHFASVGVDKLIFTKLDEATSYGQMLNVVYEVRKPIAYVTTGQNVPDDIEIPDSTCLARMFLGEGGFR